MTNPEKTLLAIYGAVSAARQALGAASNLAITAGSLQSDIEKRLATIDEDMRKLARDIAKGVGL